MRPPAYIDDTHLLPLEYAGGESADAPRELPVEGFWTDPWSQPKTSLSMKPTGAVGGEWFPMWLWLKHMY